MNIKNIIREESENFDWIRKIEPIDLNVHVKKYVDKGFVVAIWFGYLDEYVWDYIDDFVTREGFIIESNSLENAWVKDRTSIRGLTFYPNGSIGGFHGVDARYNWDAYNEEVINHGYDDINPNKFHSVEL